MQKIMFNDRYGLTQAVIEGWKTIARREPIYTDSNNFTVSCWPDTMLKKEHVRFDFDNGVSHKCRYAIGEELAVAQSYKALGYDDDALDRDPKDVFHVRGTLGRSSGWNNKMFVRAEACKANIRITNIRCERLQEISDADCKGGYSVYPGHKQVLFRGCAHGGWVLFRRLPCSLRLADRQGFRPRNMAAQPVGGGIRI